MSLPTRDAQGYPISGIDVVPQKPSPPKRSAQLTSQLTTLLVEANRREEALKDSVEYWRQKYKTLHQEYMALKFGDLCRKCQTLRDATRRPVRPSRSVQIAAKTRSPYKVFARNWKRKRTRCYTGKIVTRRPCNTASNYDGRGDDGPHPRV